MDRLEKYEKVNQCETLEQLAKVIESFSDDNGMIQGRTQKFNAKRMADSCRVYYSMPKNCLTREFGIRQQALYIEYYSSR